MKFLVPLDARLKAFLNYTLGPRLFIPRRSKPTKQEGPKVLIPHQFIGGESTLYEIFKLMAEKYGDDDAYALQLLRVLPLSLKKTWVWFDRITNLWRYEYGSPYELPNGTIISGGNVHLPVDELYIAIKIADSRLTRDQFLHFIERLSDKTKHSDVLFEMRPMKKIKGNFRISYEVIGIGIGNTTLDWEIRGRIISIVFDVKNRTKSLIENMKQFAPHADRGEKEIFSSAPNPEYLFRSVQNKLKERCFAQQMQGVWIHTDVKEDEHKIKRYFRNELNKKKVHFAILSDWEDDVFILARNPIITSVLKRVFRISKSMRFVSRMYEDGEVIKRVQ